MRRADVFQILTERLAALSCPHPMRVAVDGIDAAGKTMLAEELAAALEAQGRPVIRASIDGFHRPRAERYQRGPTSPEGYCLDSFDYAALQETLLVPLGPEGSRRYRRAIFDFRTDSALNSPEEVAPVDAILLFDGVFLLRPELKGAWDYRVFVDVPFEVALERASQRDITLFGSSEEVRTRYHARYIPGQRLYFEHAHPRERADAIVYNEPLDDPRLAFGGET